MEIIEPYLQTLQSWTNLFSFKPIYDTTLHEQTPSKINSVIQHKKIFYVSLQQQKVIFLEHSLKKKFHQRNHHFNS